MPAPRSGIPTLARACAVEMQFDISLKLLYTEICRKNAAPESEHPDQAPAFLLTVRTLQCGYPVWGIDRHATERGLASMCHIFCRHACKHDCTLASSVFPRFQFQYGAIERGALQSTLKRKCIAFFCVLLHSV